MQLDEAIRVDSSNAQFIAPYRAVLYRVQAQQECRGNDFAAALGSIDRAIQLDHFDCAALAEDYFERGSILLDAGQFQEAVGAFDSAMAIRADKPECHHSRAVALLELGCY